jgi:hypothetical protein
MAKGDAITERDDVDAAVECAARACPVPPGGCLETWTAAVEAAVRPFLPRPVPRAALLRKLAGMLEAREILRALLAAPGIEQRTPEWYAAREQMVTGSEFKDLISNPARYVREKRASASKWNALAGRLAIRWGVKFEAVACALYCARGRVVVHDFGLLPHPTVDGFGASPDGITEWGVMLEIKCPFSRKIRPCEVLAGYYTQIQAQLATTGLRACDFLEVEFEEYVDDEAFEADAHPDDARLSAEMGAEKGALVEDGGAFVVSTADADAGAVMAWVRGQREAGREPTLWRVNVFNCQRVTAEEGFMERHLDKIAYAVGLLRSGAPVDEADACAQELEFPFLLDAPTPKPATGSPSKPPRRASTPKSQPKAPAGAFPFLE